MTTTPDENTSASATPGSETDAIHESKKRSPSAAGKNERRHEVKFVTYPKLLFIWPLVLAGFVLYPFGAPHEPISATVAQYEARQAAPAPQPKAATETSAESAQNPPAQTNPYVSHRLEVLGWIYIWVLLVVTLTLGVDIGRNEAGFWVVLIAAIWVLGLWLQDVKGFTLFGDIYRWFAGLDVQYNRGFGLAVSVMLAVPYLVMIFWARVNDKWRITHNEFEHYAFGKSDDSLGRGAKTIRTSYPDVLELLLACAGTLIVYNATGTRELRRIPHVVFLPLVRKRLDHILEKTAVTTAQMEEEEEDDDDY